MNNKGAMGGIVVYVGVMVGGMLVIKALVRAMDGPDFGTTVRMRGWNSLKSVAYWQAETWGRVGIKAESRYHRCVG